MKKISVKIGSLMAIMMLAASSVKAQLPLAQGDAVVTHSPTGIPTQIVVLTIKTSNTSTAPANGTEWATPLKPPAAYFPNWTAAALGPVFGITLDENTNPNIYVSNTQIYGVGTISSKVWRLDGTTGANSLVFNFNNSTKSLGNLKYHKTATKENIYVSNWQDGAIHRLTGVSTGTALWTDNTPFNPKFGLATDDPKFLAYGLAVRNLGGGLFRLYYAKIGTVGNYGASNEIWSVDLDNAGDFYPATETLETIPPIPMAIAGISPSPIADMAFTADGSRILLGQQSWGSGFGQLSAHRARIAEFSFSSGHTWVVSNNDYPSGTYGNHANAVGGVSYSNNILQKDGTKLGCDSTVWHSADAIIYKTSSPVKYIYGIIGNRVRNNGVNDGIFIDEDDVNTNGDKTHLGDVEVYKKALNCSGATCSCGAWGGAPTLNGDPIAAVPLDIHIDHVEAADVGGSKKLPILPNGPIGPPVYLVNYPVQFVQGNAAGLFNATYQCTGNCGATYTWSITSTAGAVVASGTTLPVDVSHYNAQLQCGKYNLIIKAKCGDSSCGSQTIPITIICEPPVDCCKAAIDIDLVSKAVHPVLNLPDPNAYSTGNFLYNMQYGVPMSEVRVSVEEFRLSSTSPNCLNCSNRPVTWGNILAADINGIPLTLTGAGGIPTGSVQADYREAVYNTGTPLMPSASALRIKLSLPAITELSCCEVYAYVCLKFTFKDTQCRECVQMVCGKILLVAPKVITDPHGDPKNDKIEVKKFKVKH